MILLLVLFYFLFPVLIIYLSQKIKILDKIGAVVLAYFFGLVFGNIGIFPKASKRLFELLHGKSSLSSNEVQQLFEQGLIDDTDIVVNQIAFTQNALISIVILLAVPLLLFSMDIKKWLGLAKGALFSLMLAMASLLVAIFIGYFIYKDQIDESWKIAGLLVGLYTGGTPNLAVIGTALDIDTNIFLLTHSYDMIIGAVCLLFLLIVAQRLFNTFLPSFKANHDDFSSASKDDQYGVIESFEGIFSNGGLLKLIASLGCSLIIVAIGAGISLLVPEAFQMVTVILSITTLGLIFSNWKPINKMKYTFQMGMYFIIVFSLVVASMGDLLRMFNIEYLNLFGFVALVVIGSMAIHVFLSYIFKVDTDTTIITITALTFSPPFVPVVAGALKNKDLIISGLTIGILGYAIGNYLGLAIAYLLM